MADTEPKRYPVIWIVVVVLVGGYAFWLSGQIDETQSHLSAAQERERQLAAQVQTLAMAAASPAPAVESAPEPLVIALLRRPDLIPFEGVVGGTFYYLEDSVRILSRDLLYVTVEDGHIQGHLLLRFRGEGDAVEFDVVASHLD